MANHLYKGDLPDKLDLGSEIAIDTETMGLNNFRDRLCVIQISSGDGHAHLVQFEKDEYDAPNLRKLLNDENVVKIMHYARFDMAILQHTFGFPVKNIYCTKIASKLARTYTDYHGLKNLVKEVLDVDVSKKQQSSYWGAETLTKDQIKYAASDVLYLHKLKEHLDMMLKKEGRQTLAKECFEFLNTRVDLDLKGWLDLDIFMH